MNYEGVEIARSLASSQIARLFTDFTKQNRKLFFITSLFTRIIHLVCKLNMYNTEYAGTPRALMYVFEILLC